MYVASVNPPGYFPPYGPVGNPPTYGFQKAVKTYLCPSDPSAGQDGVVKITDSGWAAPNDIWGACSYALNVQVFCKVDAQGRYPSQIGPSEGRPVIPGSFPDGLSNTILIAEKYARCVLRDSSGRTVYSGGGLWAYWNVFGTTVNGVPFGPFHGAFAASYWDQGQVNPPRGVTIGPQSKFLLQPNPFTSNCDPTRASTPHTGGMQTLLGDGSVRTLSPGISGTTWWAACTPAGGETLGQDW
jgi:hypothetical protein